MTWQKKRKENYRTIVLIYSDSKITNTVLTKSIQVHIKNFPIIRPVSSQRYMVGSIIIQVNTWWITQMDSRTEITRSFVCKLLEEKVWEMLGSICTGKHFVGAQKERRTADKWDPMMLKSSTLERKQFGAGRTYRIGEELC